MCTSKKSNTPLSSSSEQPQTGSGGSGPVCGAGTPPIGAIPLRELESTSESGSLAENPSNSYSEDAVAQSSGPSASNDTAEGNTPADEGEVSNDAVLAENDIAPEAASPATTAGSANYTRRSKRSPKRPRIPKLAECAYVPGPGLEQVLADLGSTRAIRGRVLVGPWETLPYRFATYLYTNPALLTNARAIPFGSKNAVEKAVRSGLALPRDRIIEAGRIVRDLPDVRLGAPVREADDIIILQPQQHETLALARLIRSMAAPGARVVLIGYEPFSIRKQVDEIVHPLFHGLARLLARSQRHLYQRFRGFPLRLHDDPAFDHAKERRGEVKWSFEDLVAYLESLRSMQRLKLHQPKRPGDLHLPFDDRRALASPDRLKKAWGTAKSRKVIFKLVVRSGYLPS